MRVMYRSPDMQPYYSLLLRKESSSQLLPLSRSFQSRCLNHFPKCQIRFPNRWNRRLSRYQRSPIPMTLSPKSLSRIPANRSSPKTALN